MFVLFIFVQAPKTSKDWDAVAKDFDEKWNFPNCLGSIGRKAVKVRSPCGGGVKSIIDHARGVVFLGVVDANHEFIHIDVSGEGADDGDDFNNWSLDEEILAGNVELPAEKTLPGSATEAPHVFVGDSSVSSFAHILEPFPEEGRTAEENIFCYRLSRAKRVAENAFGALTSKFRVLQSLVYLAPDKVEKVILASVVLHNMLMRNHSNIHVPSGFLDEEDVENGELLPGMWRLDNRMTDIPPNNDVCHLEDTLKVRQIFTDFFNKEGSVPWQEKMVESRTIQDVIQSIEELEKSCQ